MTKKIAVLFRTHVGGDMVTEGFEHLQAIAPEGVDIYFACDETRGPLAAPEGAVKFSHSNLDVEKLGLLLYRPQQLLWYNCDYIFYLFYHQHPQYDFYLTVEYDVFFAKGSFEKLLAHILATEDDFYSAYCHKSSPEWPWHKTALGFNDDVYQSFFPIIAMSNRAAEHLLSKRLSQGQAYREGQVAEDLWAFGEAFAPTEIAAAGFSINSFEDSLGLTKEEYFFENIRCIDFLDSSDPSLGIRHPVLDREMFFKKLFTRAGKFGLPHFFGRNPGTLKDLKKFDDDLLESLLNEHASPTEKQEVLDAIESAA